MESERERMKRALLAEIEGIVDEVLDWEEKHSAPTLAEIEEVVLKVRQRVGQWLARFLVERHEAVRPIPEPACPHCGQEMRYKGNSPVTMVSRVGPLEIRRGYYYCERCQSGLFPPGPVAGVEEQHWSEGVVKEVVWLSVLMPYEQVAETLERVGQIPISATTAWRLAQERGERFRQWEEAERRAANTLAPGKGVPERRERRRGKRMGVAMDGG